MKSPADACLVLDRRLRQTWHDVVIGAGDGWPLRVPLGRPDSATLSSNFRTVQQWILTWRDWAHAHSLEMDWETRMIHGTRHALPTHLHVPDAHTAANTLGKAWQHRLDQGGRRWALLSGEFPLTATADHVRYVDTLSDTDFTLLVTATRWFHTHDATGLTPRQVPIAGLHGKWLNHHRTVIAVLAGHDLGLVARPTRIHFTYVDPAHLAAGGRSHDSLTLGDHVRLPYPPQAIVITENKDTAVLFPPMDGTIVIEGGGQAGSGLLPQVDWVRSCPTVIYWGDMDSRGYEIVNTLRTNGVAARTMLMDPDTFSDYAKYGTYSDDKGVPLSCQPRKPLPTLTEDERRVYEQVTDPAFTGPRRVEQERVPLPVALEQARRIVAAQPVEQA